MEVRMETEEDVVFEDTTEAEILSLDSISEATQAIEAETSVILEAMFGSEQGVSQPSDTLKVPQSDMIHQEVEKESGEQEGNILEAMSLESVTLAEVEASLGTLENESLSETAAFLENEAEILAVETRTEVEELPPSDDHIEDLSVESPALPEADGLSEDLQTDELMEELLFTVPGPAAGLTEVQRPVGAKTLDDMDPIQRLFLEKIREYNNMRRLGEGPVEAGSEYERHLSEETAKLQSQYGGGDLSSFPQFTFTEPKMDEDSK
ncbi:hypothetical protein INR49_007580 [Caranx melampygus]|nr:hypothetical protein INR49_007580 [Caranx melampygus]